MKLVSFTTRDGKTYPGVLQEPDNLIRSLAGAGFQSALEVIAAGVTQPQKDQSNPSFKLSEVRLHAPLPNPPRIFAIGLNYRDHAIESGMAIPTTPSRLLQADHRHHRPRRPHRASQKLHPARLRSRVRLRHRQRRLSHPRRQHGATTSTATPSSTTSAPATCNSPPRSGPCPRASPPSAPRPRHCHRRRNPRPARTRHQPLHRRRSPAKLQYPRTDLQYSRR